jgi:prephenate dehydrogenase
VFARIAILGTGLIGGSFGLAVRRRFPQTSIVGWDRPEVLPRAAGRGAIDVGHTELADALRGADLIYVALPLGATIDLLPPIARHAESHAQVTDTCGTKVELCRLAAKLFHEGARFLGGHPMAGKETKGIENADPDLFVDATYLLIAEESDRDPRVTEFAALLQEIGARPTFLDAETHDWAVSIVSHLPQMLALALAQVLRDETDETGLPLALAGPGLRDSLRLAGSPYDVWRDLCLANRENIRRALDRLLQALEHVRSSLTSRELEQLFADANQVYQKLREVK